jgi:hypothetical protein
MLDTDRRGFVANSAGTWTRTLTSSEQPNEDIFAINHAFEAGYTLNGCTG